MNLKRFITKLTATLTAIVAVLAFSLPAIAQEDVAAGQKLFEENCTACHAIDTKVIGPALKGVHERPGRSEKWLISWIKNAPEMIAKGDPLAVKLYEENNKANMTVFATFSDNDVKNILAYIKTGGTPPVDGGGEISDTGLIPPAPPVPPTSANESVVSLINVLLVIIVIAVLLIIGYVFDVLGQISRYTGIPLTNPHKVNAWIMIIFMVVGLGAVIWEFKAHGQYVLIDNAASEHGDAVDSMLMVTLWITGGVFFITQILLFAFGFLYRYDPKRKALFYPHNNMLEYIWTLVPAVALTVLVINGFTKWSAITKKAPAEAETVEVFAYQFGWNVRYAGDDNKLGEYSFNLISGTNPLGLGVKGEYTKLVDEITAAERATDSIITIMNKIPDPTSKEKEEMAGLKKRLKLQQAHLSRLLAINKDKRLFDKTSEDDVITKEIVLVKGKPIHFVFRARDVIHSAYSPHFRMQMNCVPGMPTTFWFVPTKTTGEMRSILDDPKFDYYLYCAKICGAAHYNMRIKIRVVDTEAEYDRWMAEQKPAFKADDVIPAVEEVAPATTDSTAAKTVALLN